MLLQYISKHQKQLDKLIKLGKEITSIHLAEERSVNYEEHYRQGYENDFNLEDFLEPEQYSKSQEKSLKWRTQCRNLLHQLPIQNTIYKELLELLAENPKKPYFRGIQVQEITIKLDALLEDYQDSLLDSMVLNIQGNSSLNYIEQANEFFDQEYYVAAGLIATTALEGFLKNIYISLSAEDIMSENDDNNEEINSVCKDKKTKKLEGLKDLSNRLKHIGYIDKSTLKKIHKWADLRNDFVHNNNHKNLNLDRDLLKELILEINAFISSRISNNLGMEI